MNVRESVTKAVHGGLLVAVDLSGGDREVADALFRRAELEFEPYIEGLMSPHMVSPVSTEQHEFQTKRHAHDFRLYLGSTGLSESLVRLIVYRLQMETHEQLQLLHSADRSHRRFQLQPAV